MNIFEKYIKNVNENKELDKTIKSLCILYLINGNEVIERLGLTTPLFVKFIRFEFEDKYYPEELTIYYIGKTYDTGEEKECSSKVKWSALLVKTDNYE